MKSVRHIVIVSFLFATAAYAGNPFDGVFEIMTRPRGPSSMGCRGCHIGAEPVSGIPYFGSTQDEVETYLRTDDFGHHVGGIGTSPIARRLRQDGDPAPMPRAGMAWGQDELDKLILWL